MREPPTPAGGTTMQDGPRVLVAAALGKIIEPLLRQALADANIRIAEDPTARSTAAGSSAIRMLASARDCRSRGSMIFPSAAATRTRGPSCMVVPPAGAGGSLTRSRLGLAPASAPVRRGHRR